MIWTVTEEQLYDENVRKHAGGKAREDLSTIFAEHGFGEIIIRLPQIERQNASSFQKLKYHIEVSKKWKEALRTIKKGDALVLQFPVINHTLLLNNVLKNVKNRGVKIYAFIHDLEYLRMSNDTRVTWAMRWRMKREELDELELFDKIVVHNDSMKSLMINKLGIGEDKLLSLELFDYLISDDFKPKMDIDNYQSCIIAGNLKRNKSKYIYELPTAPAFELYGVNYEGSDNMNLNYHGSFLADDLPFHLKGGFGLVWDGDSARTCSGAWGEYLRFNNPHKTSLYLACGIPVIIWEDAALASFIRKHNVGLTVKTLFDLEDTISKLSDEEYLTMKKNAVSLSEKVRKGFYTDCALKQIGLI